MINGAEVSPGQKATVRNKGTIKVMEESVVNLLYLVEGKK
jgi:hypothetical protein